MSLRWGIMAIIAMCTLTLPVLAADNNRMCQEKDLNGHFVLVYFQETPEGSEAQWHKNYPYHYLAFYPGQLYSTIASGQEIKDPKQLNQMLAPRTEAHNYYRLNDKGQLDLYSENKIRYSYRCVVNLTDTGQLKKNDLVMTGYSRDGASRYALYRRWY